MKSKYKITKSLAEVYKKSNPSTYFVNNKRFKQHNNGRKKLLLNLKLPPKLFKNSTLIDFSSLNKDDSGFIKRNKFNFVYIISKHLLKLRTPSSFSV